MQYHKCHDKSLLQSHDENQINTLKKVQEKLQFSSNANLKHKREIMIIILYVKCTNMMNPYYITPTNDFGIWTT
jgi:hypothetical protein